jgi:hypothetical protein
VAFDVAPSGIEQVVVRLTRVGYTDRILVLTIIDSAQGAYGTMANVAGGTWHVKIDALDASGTVQYTGETDVEVKPGQTASVVLELVPATGSISFHVTWGSGCASVTGGPVSWWEGEGNGVDVKGGNTGLWDSPPTYGTGKVGRAFHFDGTAARIIVRDSDNLKITGSLTIEAWINLESYPVGYAAGQILMRGDSRPGFDPYYLAVLPTGELLFAVSSLTASDGITAPVALNRFLHVAGVLDTVAGRMKLYINGSLVGEKTTAVQPFRDLDPSYEPGLGIGNTPITGTAHNHPFHGTIDELAIYSRALTSAELRAIYHAGSVGKCN